MIGEQICATPSLESVAAAAITDEAIARAVADAVSQVGSNGVIDVKEHWREGIAVEVGTGFVLDAALAFRAPPARPAGNRARARRCVCPRGRRDRLRIRPLRSDPGRVRLAQEGAGAGRPRRRRLGAGSDRPQSARARPARRRPEADRRFRSGGSGPSGPRDRDGRDPDQHRARPNARKCQTVDARPGTAPAICQGQGALRRSRRRSGGDRAAPRGTRRRGRAGQVLSLDREHALRRAARLAGAWGEISVGGRTKPETALALGEARAALACVQAAIASGVVAGGGAALVRVADAIRQGAGTGSLEERAAHRCVASGLEAVAAQIARNAGRDPGEWIARLRARDGRNVDTDARGGASASSISEGVVDPCSITCGIVGRAASAAATLLRAEALICR